MNSLLLTRKQRRKARKDKLRANKKIRRRLLKNLVFAPCYYCRHIFMADQLTVEHLVPIVLGGTNDEANIALACAPCNQQRGREAWFRKKQLMKEYYEQHSAQHQK